MMHAPRIRPSLLAILISLGLVALGPISHAWASPVIVYGGRLEDARHRPIGGIFPLSFALHRTPKGGRPLWSESLFVAVDHGHYQVPLGKTRPIPATLDLGSLYLSVSITGGAEILREKLNSKDIRRERGTASQATRASSAGRAGQRVVDYAETAGLAYEAEHAKVADKLGTLSADDVQEQLKNARGKVTIGSSNRYTSSAGGEGGVAYELRCPKGYVVTGIRGGSGIYVDSLQLICSPLQ